MATENKRGCQDTRITSDYLKLAQNMVKLSLTIRLESDVRQWLDNQSFQKNKKKTEIIEELIQNFRQASGEKR